MHLNKAGRQSLRELFKRWRAGQARGQSVDLAKALPGALDRIDQLVSQRRQLRRALVQSQALIVSQTAKIPRKALAELTHG